MPRYFFDTQNGENDTDDVGIDLPDNAKAVEEAVRYAGAMINDEPALLAETNHIMIRVRSELGIVARVRIALERI